jgi:hypothetical protein
MARVSYIELLSEHTRPEPRLRRLLGHVSIYMNATQWQRQMMEDTELSFIEGEERMTSDAASRAESGQRGPLAASVDKPQRVHTFSEFQARIRANSEDLSLCTVTATEMTGDGEESDESSESEGSEESEWCEIGGGDLGDNISGESEDAECIELPPYAFMLGDGKGAAVEWPSWPIGKGAQIYHPQSWGQQPRVLTTSGSETAFFDVRI